MMLCGEEEEKMEADEDHYERMVRFGENRCRALQPAT